MIGRVVAVHRSPVHAFSKTSVGSITLLAGLGVDGDAHCGASVKHRSRVAQDPTQPNLRQVHLIPAELLDALASQGFSVTPGDLGENITTQGLALRDLPVGSRLQIGAQAVVVLTGLRNPCAQIEAFQPGLLAAVLERTDDGRLIRKAGVMGVVSVGGTVQPNDPIAVQFPPSPQLPLERV
jgi:MOSC domain-containing protein YiiM